MTDRDGAAGGAAGSGHPAGEARPTAQGGPERRDDDQLELLPDLARARAREARRTRAGQPSPGQVAEVDPVARVLVDVPLAHLDRPFDYLVPGRLAESAVPGSRVKVRFAGQDVDGFVVERVAASEHPGRLAPLRRSVSAEPVLSPAVARLSAAVAARYAGTRADVLRLAVPPRHARVEKQATADAPPGRPEAPAPGGWCSYRGGERLLGSVAGDDSPRVIWQALPGDDWADLLARAAATVDAGGRGALVCVPDQRDLARLDAALRDHVGEGRHVLLSADTGPAARYRAFLAVSRGAVRVVAGTRSAAFAPVADLGLVALWDDGDDLYAEPRAPYPHTREVLLQRAQDEGCAALIGGYARSVEADHLLRTGWATEVAPGREAVRDRVSVTLTGATDLARERDVHATTARLPREASVAIRHALGSGPVLVQTPRSGYASALACSRCRSAARCPGCAGPLASSGPGEPPACRWCGTPQPAWTCATCGGRGMRAPVVGERRTAEEIGRAFPATPVRTSAGDQVLDRVPATPAIVVATPGAEPVAEGGYAAVLLLDTGLALARPDLRAEEETLRRWFNAAALARRPAEGGRVVAVGESRHPALQALLRWDPGGFAERAAAERRSAHLPPASRVATLTAAPTVLEEAAASLTLPAGAEVLGPVPVVNPGPSPVSEPQQRFVVRVPRAAGPALSRALTELQGVRSARKLPAVRVQVDPVQLG